MDTDTNRDRNANVDAVVYTDDMDEVVEEEEKPKRRLPKGCGCLIAALVVLLVLGGGGAYVGATTIFRTEKPLPLEKEVTDILKRYVMIPGEFHDRRMPNRASVNVATGKKLFDFPGDPSRDLIGCAMCHGQAGRGDSKLGASMYPPASDLADPSNVSKTDGQLYWIIAHGLNLTGMPAFGEGYMPYGKGYTEDEIWSLVKYIREEIQGQK